MVVSPNTTLPVRASVWTVSSSLAVTNDIAVCFLFLSVLRCFSSRRSLLRVAIVKGFPLGDPQFLASMQLPEAYRSLARPSSVLEPSYPPDGKVAIRWYSDGHCNPFELIERVQWTSGLHVHTVS